MKFYLTLLALASFSFFGVSCDTYEDEARTSVTRETTSTIDPLSGTANTSTTVTRVDRKDD